MLIRLYFAIKKRDVPKGELEKVVAASMAESVKTELQHTAGVRCMTNGEGGLMERKRGGSEKITSENKEKIAKFAAAIRHFSSKHFLL